VRIAERAGGERLAVQLRRRIFAPLHLSRLLRAMTASVPRAPWLAYGLGIFRIPTPCGPAFGHDGELPGYASLALNGRHGRRQAIVLVNSNTPSETVGPPAAQSAYTRLVATAFCG
jgi:D-alanyl-D-alanine carboxypeptidase